MRERCPSCDQVVRMVAGLECPKCGHRLGVQNLDTDWRQIDVELGRKMVRGSDEQTRPDRSHNPKRRYPLRFK